MTRDSWVIGAGGLLGSSVVSRLRARGDDPVRARIPWADPDAAVVELGRQFPAVDELDVYWCAGAGVTATPKEVLDAEVEVFRRFLIGLRQTETRVARLFLASSVGGVYAGGRPPFTEDSPELPLSAYGRAKLEMERLARELAAEGRTDVLIGRISNLYGPAQNPDKGQGLISTIARSVVTSQPVNLYVSLDTIRDYVYAEDCASVVVAGMDMLEGGRGRTVVKIIASQRGTTIAALLADVRRLTRRRVPVVLSGGGAPGQAPDLRVRSVVWPELDRYVRTPLGVGIHRILMAALAEQQAASKARRASP